jgi:hypothetical protein
MWRLAERGACRYQSMTAYHQFVRLLYQACFASEAVDHYNLVESENRAYLSTWHWLLNEQYISTLALIEYVRAQSDAIIATMVDPPATVPEEPPPKLLRSADLIDARFAFLTHYALEAERAARELDHEPPQRRQSRLKVAHGRCLHNRRLLANGGRCGCFYCLRTFDANDVTEWVDEGLTARCPHCGIDAVLSEKSDPIHPWFLKRMQTFWFRSRKLPLPV